MNNAVNLSKKLDSNRSNVLVNPVNTINVSVMSSEDPHNVKSTVVNGSETNPYSANESQQIPELMVKYPTETDLLITKLESENAALKVIIEMLRSNPLMIIISSLLMMIN